MLDAVSSVSHGDPADRGGLIGVSLKLKLGTSPPTLSFDGRIKTIGKVSGSSETYGQMHSSNLIGEVVILSLSETRAQNFLRHAQNFLPHNRFDSN